MKDQQGSLPLYQNLPPPSGWYVAAQSADLPPRGRLNICFLGQDLLLYRTTAGLARAVAPHCPHLGAHLGHNGTVQGELLRCEFHRFCFDSEGVCAATGYGTRPPKTARLTTFPTREQDGAILVYHHPAGEPPSWEIPALDAQGWSPPHFHTFRLHGHPQDTTENSVDLGHFACVHGYRDVRVLTPARTEGPYLTARYAMQRGLGPLAFRTEFTIHVHGLGYSMVDVEVKSHGIHSRQFVYATPTEPGQITLRIAVSIKEVRPLPRLPRRLLAELLARFVMFFYVIDVQQDVRIWEHKRYLPAPALAAGDGPIGLYRRWARQFYQAAPASQAGAGDAARPQEETDA